MSKAAKKAKKAKRQPLLIEGQTVEPPPKQRRELDAQALTDLCNHIALGNSLRSWAEQEGIPHNTIVDWILKDEERNKLYREARRMQADAHIDQLIELADAPVPCDADGRTDSGAVQQLRVRIDTRKWVAAKFYPALYGDRVAVDANVTDGTKERPADVMAKIAAFLGAHGLRLTTADNEPGSDR